jgi:hypothetical protein
VKRAFIGAKYEEHEDVNFNSIEFSVEGLDEWVGVSGFEIQSLGTSTHVSINYTQPEPVIINLNNGMTLEILFKCKASPLSLLLKEITLTQQAYFRLSSKCTKQFSDYTTVIHRLTNFIGFAVGKTVSINSMIGISDDVQIEMDNGKKINQPIKIYYRSSPFSSEEPKVNIYEILFGFKQIASNVTEVINAWFDAYDAIEPPINLFFATRTGAYKYTNGKFLALAQCLESFHRLTSNKVDMDPQQYREIISAGLESFPKEHRSWFMDKLQYGYELSLANRLRDLIAPFIEYLESSTNQQQKFIRLIVDTRNYYTHYDETLRSKAATSGNDLYILCKKLDVLFQLHLFTILKFPKPIIVSIFKEKLEPQLKFGD